MEKYFFRFTTIQLLSFYAVSFFSGKPKGPFKYNLEKALMFRLGHEPMAARW